eukprot:502883_1
MGNTTGKVTIRNKTQFPLICNQKMKENESLNNHGKVQRHPNGPARDNDGTYYAVSDVLAEGAITFIITAHESSTVKPQGEILFMWKGKTVEVHVTQYDSETTICKVVKNKAGLKVTCEKGLNWAVLELEEK